MIINKQEAIAYVVNLSRSTKYFRQEGGNQGRYQSARVPEGPDKMMYVCMKNVFTAFNAVGPMSTLTMGPGPTLEGLASHQLV